MMRRALWGILLVLIAASPAVAKRHPVRLDSKTDAAKCLECHENKSKGKIVHAAVQMGCLTCHEIRNNKVATHVKLTTPTPAKLCVQCHSEKDASQLKGLVHAPAARDCIKCHDPHTSENKNLLLKPASGDAKNNLCLGCHGLPEPPKDGSRHAALEMGCDTCHVTHKVGDRENREFHYHLTKNAPALCIDCHAPSDAALLKAHQGQPFAAADCVGCHEPHQSRFPKLMQAVQHSPFEAKACDTCHQPPKGGKVVLTANGREMCLSCHDDKAKVIETAKVQHPGAAGDCTDCHNPHASKWPRLPKTNPVQICTGCHSDLGDQGKKAHPHQPAFKQGCATCHTAHGGENDHLLRASNPNTLCLECHGPDSKPQPVPNEPMVTIFNGQVKLPNGYFRDVVTLPLKYNLGHPVTRHPVSQAPNPGNPTAPGMNCLTCHQPHASAKPSLLVKDQTYNTAFCQTCHKDLTQLNK